MITSRVQETLIMDLADTSDNYARVSHSLIEEIFDLLSDVSEVIEIGVVSENSPGPIRDRCFFCVKRVKELRQALLSLLDE